MVVFNEIHNQHLQTSVGIVSILTEDKKYENLKIMGLNYYENNLKDDIGIYLELKIHMS